MTYSPCFRRMASCNSCMWKPRTKGHSWHRSIYMWKRYLHYRGQEILGQSGKKRTRKWSTFKDCHRFDRCSLKQSYFLSFEVRVGPISTQTTRGERTNPKNTPRLRQVARSTLKFSLKQDFLALKVKEHHSLLFFRQVSEPIGTSFWRKFERLCCL